MTLCRSHRWCAGRGSGEEWEAFHEHAGREVAAAAGPPHSLHRLLIVVLLHGGGQSQVHQRRRLRDRKPPARHHRLAASHLPIISSLDPGRPRLTPTSELRGEELDGPLRLASGEGVRIQPHRPESPHVSPRAHQHAEWGHKDLWKATTAKRLARLEEAAGRAAHLF